MGHETSKTGTNFKLIGYFVLGEFERHTSRLASITEVFTNMKRDMVRSACTQFRGRIESDIEAKDAFIL